MSDDRKVLRPWHVVLCPVPTCLHIVARVSRAGMVDRAFEFQCHHCDTRSCLGTDPQRPRDPQMLEAIVTVDEDDYRRRRERYGPGAGRPR